MDASFFIILFFVLVGVLSLIKTTSGSGKSNPIDSNAKPFQSSKLISIGSFKAYQHIGSNQTKFDFDSTIEYDNVDNSIIILIDGLRFGTKMKINSFQKNSLIDIIDKAIEWSEKANEAKLTADKLISSIQAIVSFFFNNEIYNFNSCDIKFYFYNDADDSTGSKIFLVSNKYDVGGVIIPPSIIWIDNSEFEKVKSIITEENIQSSLNEGAEKSKIVDEILT